MATRGTRRGRDRAGARPSGSAAPDRGAAAGASRRGVDAQGADDIVIGRLEADDVEVRALLADLELHEQDRYDHPRQTRAEIASRQPPLRTGFTGENHILVARDRTGAAIGVCWCVLFDPGTGLEGEVAELVVGEGVRGQGVASRLLREAVALFRRRSVTFACVWTHADNAAALAAYRAAGFAPTEQTVLTWLPMPGRGGTVL